jgi:hypothetical protein
VAARDGDDLWVDDEMLETHLTSEPPELAMLAAEVEPWSHEYPTVPVKRAVYADRPLPGLLRAATGARLLVVGHRGHGPLARAVLGSVAHGVIKHATGTATITHTQDKPVALSSRPATEREPIRG